MINNELLTKSIIATKIQGTEYPRNFCPPGDNKSCVGRATYPRGQLILGKLSGGGGGGGGGTIFPRKFCRRGVCLFVFIFF